MTIQVEETVTRWGVSDDIVGVTPFASESQADHYASLYRGADVVYDLEYPNGKHSGWIYRDRSGLGLDIGFDCD